MSEMCSVNKVAVKRFESVPKDGTLLVFGKTTMGEGDADFGALLTKMFFQTLAQSSQLPQNILFFNSGVKLTSKGSPILQELRTLAEKGVWIHSGEGCLNHYTGENELEVGDIVGMEQMVQLWMSASKVIEP